MKDFVNFAIRTQWKTRFIFLCFVHYIRYELFQKALEFINNFWTCTSNLTTVVNSVLKFMINGTTSILKSYIFQTCAAIYQLLLHMVFTSRNWFAMQGPVAIILISWNVIFIWETGYWTRAIKRFALFDLLKSLYSDTKILSKYIPSLQKRL